MGFSRAVCPTVTCTRPATRRHEGRLGGLSELVGGRVVSEIHIDFEFVARIIWNAPFHQEGVSERASLSGEGGPGRR
jgi:hypothetical protein